MSAHLNVCVEPGCCICWLTAAPGEARTREFDNGKRRVRTNHNLVGLWSNLQHEARLAVGCGLTDVQTLALTDGETVSTGVLTQNVSAAVNDVAIDLAQLVV